MTLDQTGAVVVGVNLNITDLETKISRKAVSAQDGRFEFPELKPGTYRLEAAHPGFQNFIADNLILESHQIRRLDVTLAVGSAATAVTVVADAAVIEPEDPKISASFTGKDYETNPMLRVDMFAVTYVAATMPGVQPSESGVGVSVAGQSNQLQLGTDGATTEGGVNQVSNASSMTEIKVVTSGNSAEYARAGYFDVIGTRGVNDLHGRVYYYHANSALNARGFFDPRKAPQKYHAFGAAASGPILRDRTFFSAVYDGQRDPSSNWITQSVPTAAMRTGNFAGLLNLPSKIVVTDPTANKQPFPGNVIPTSRLSPLALKVQNDYVTLPNQGSPDSFSNNMSYLHPYSADDYKLEYVEGRVDHKFSDSNEFFARMSNRWSPYVLSGNWPGLFWTRNRYAGQMVFSDTHLFTPTLVNTARFSWYINNTQDGNSNMGVKPTNGAEVVKQIGLQGVNPDGLSAMGFPRMDITGYNALRTNPGGVLANENYRQFAEGLTYIRGTHTMKFGGEFKTFNRYIGQVPESTYGYFTFNGTVAGYAYADFLLGIPATSRRLRPLTNQTLTSWELGMYFSDTWKATRRLSLTYGVRWDRFGAAGYEDGLQYNFDTKTGSVVVPNEQALSRVSPLYPTNLINVAVGDTRLKPSNRNFIPRVGVGYQLTPKTVLRGAWGMFTEFPGEFAYAQTGGPYQLQETFSQKITNGVPLFQFPNPFPAGAGSIPSQSVNGYPTAGDDGVIHQYNVTLERDLANVGLSASYIGSRAFGMNYNLSINQQPWNRDPVTGERPPKPWPNIVGVNMTQHDGETRYDSLQLRGRTRSRGVYLDAHWTWAHNTYNYGNLENAYNHYFWNRQSFTPQHRAVATVSYDLPVGRKRRYLSSAPRVLEGALGGWSVYLVSILQSGRYMSPTFSGTNPADGLSYTGSPDRIADGNLPAGERTMQRWFDTSAFVPPPRDRLGNSGKNIIAGPGQQVHNFSVTKTFPIYERMKLNLTLAAINLLNHPNFSPPATNVVGPTAGVISSVIGGSNIDGGGFRRINLRMRITW